MELPEGVGRTHEMRCGRLRKQYHSRRVGPDLFTWDVPRLVRLSENLPVTSVPLSEISEIDENWWYGEGEDLPSPRSIADHMVLVGQTDLTHPILLCAEGRLMDGMHRIVRPLIEHRTHISAIRFPVTPEPDYVNASVEDLPYDE